MANPRRKSIALEAPQTIEAATDLAGRYIGLLIEAEKMRLDADAHIAAIEKARDEFVKPIEQAMKDMFGQLRAWWAVAEPAMTSGKRKSILLAGAVLGKRMSTPRLSLGNKKPDFVIGALDEAQLDDFIRVRKSLDKPALLKALAMEGPDAEALAVIGLRRVQAEEFFIDRAGDPAPVEIVPHAEEEA